MKVSRIVLFVALGMVHIWFGIIPAWTRIDTDFPNYYTSARLVIEGRDLSRIYDAGWFQSQIDRLGITQQGIFAPLPPVTALIMLPVAFLPPQAALRAWTVVNLILLAGAIALLSRCTGRDWLFSAILFLGSGIALINDIRFGQVYLLIAFLVLAGYLALKSRHSASSGAAFGVAAALKYFPLAYIPFLLARKERKAIFWLVGTLAATYLASLLLLGTEVHRQFAALLAAHLDGEILNPFGAGLQSWNSLFRRAFVLDPLFNPDPLIQWPAGYFVLTYLVYLAVLIQTVRSWKRAETAFGPSAPGVQFALVNIAALLLLPASSTYLFLLMVFPVALLLGSAGTRWRPEQKMIVVLFTLISWIPYRVFRPFDGRGILTVVAYPRLGLLLCLFVATVLFIRNYNQVSTL
jgi:hypothetical protein